MNPPEPKGVIPLQITADLKMDSIMVNYKNDAELENELDMVDMGNYVRYDEQGHSRNVHIVVDLHWDIFK